MPRMRGSAWKFLASPHYKRNGHRSQFSPPNSFSNSYQNETLLTDDSTSSVEEDTDNAVLFGYLRGNVVGVRYYSGVVNNNEMVALQREPNNQYDTNAVKVNNVNGDQVGHIKRELAQALAYIMDRKLAKVEGVVPYGAHNVFTMPLQLHFWGNEENKPDVLAHMKKHGFILGPLPSSSQFPGELNVMSPRAGPSYSAPVTPAVQMTTEQLKTEFDKLFEDLKEDEKSREMEPSEALGTQLLIHQKQALAWMVSCENSKELPPFWEQRNDFYYNILTNFAVRERPENVKGGILADDMGLGKTLTTIALILTNFHGGQHFPTVKIKELEMQESNLAEEFVENKVSNSKRSNRQSKASRSKERSESSSSMCSKEECETNPLDISGNRPKRQRDRKVKYTFSSDSEDVEEHIPRKVKPCNLQEEDLFAASLSGLPSETKKKFRTKGKSKSQNCSNVGSEGLPRTTLIICPLSVLSNWIDQFEQHLKPEIQLNVDVYYGPERTKDPEVLSSQDVVLTTYSVLTYDYGNRGESPLHKVKWLRVVLDEGHTIRNPNTQQTKAVFSLEAERRWVLTGTPIQNTLKDLWSLLSFLKLRPFTEREWWHRTIQRPVTMGNKVGLRRLQALIKCITLRRTKTSKIKGKLVLELPERRVFVQHLQFSDEERLIYESVKKEGTTLITKYVNEGSVLVHYADVLAVLVRLRQLCCHPHLVSSSLPSVISAANSTPEELRKMLVNKIKFVLDSGSDEECAICLHSLNMPVITRCAHVFCKPCISQVIQCEKPKPKCPLCRAEVYQEHLVECPEEGFDCNVDKKADQKWRSSSKINALMHELIIQRNAEPHTKSIIVSQFTAYLSLIQEALRESAFMFTRLDGSMTQKKRTEAIQCFQSGDADSPSIMLLSLKAGGVGLNLTAASRVFLMDPSWNPAAEEQCFDRCHRLGQKKDVTITKFIVTDSVEEKMIRIQNAKRNLVAGAFGIKPSASEMKQARIDELRALVDL